jgi:hypothetical protein
MKIKSIIKASFISTSTFLWVTFLSVFPQALTPIQAQQVQNQQYYPTILELFTSQGCSSCPPADAALKNFGKDKDLIPLAFHVDYWDGLGWKDIFSSAEFTERQKFYQHALKTDYIFTPQMIVQGRYSAVGSRVDKVLSLIDQYRQENLVSYDDIGLNLSIDQGELLVDLDHKTKEHGPLLVLALSYDQQHITEIERGENAGRTIDNQYIVRDMHALGRWNGASKQDMSLDLHQLTGKDGIVVLLHHLHDGKIYVGQRILR